MTVPLPTDTRQTLSPSAMQSYEICGRRGQYYQDPTIPRKTGLATAVGSGWHKAMEVAAVSGSHDRGVLWDAALGEFVERTQQDNFVLHPGEALDDGLEQMQLLIDSYLSRDPGGRWVSTDIELVAVERELWADFGSEYHIFHGIIDKVVRVSGDLIGVDEKSAGRRYGGAKGRGDPRHLGQAPLYAEAWYQNYGEEIPFFAYDVTTKNKGEFTRIWVPTHPDARRPFVDKWRDWSKTIAMSANAGIDMPTNPTSFLCSEKWCDYYEICPMGSAIDAHLIPQP